MFSTVVFLVFIGFLLLYNTSKKSRWSDKPAWAASLEQRKPFSVALSALAIILAGTLLVMSSGFSSGLFMLIVVIMAMASLNVLVFPFRYLSIRHIVALFLGFIVLEQLIF